MQKGYFIPIIGIAVSILVVGGALYIKAYRGSTSVQTPSTISTPQASSDSFIQSDYTKDWRVYTDNIYHFSFKYPKDWQFTKPALDLHPNNKTLLQINLINPSYDKNKVLSSDFGGPGDHPSDPDKDPYAITIIVWDNNEGKSLKEQLIEIDKLFQNSQQGFCPLLPESVDVKEHERCLKNAAGVAMSEKILTAGDYLYLISGGPMDSRANYKFSQITNTFKFTQ